MCLSDCKLLLFMYVPVYVPPTAYSLVAVLLENMVIFDTYLVSLHPLLVHSIAMTLHTQLFI
jgi:hypothetical protein